MPAKGSKGRAAKKCGVEKTQENVIDSTTNQKVDENASEVDAANAVDKKNSKRKQVVKEKDNVNNDGGDVEVLPQKRSRGKQTSGKVEQNDDSQAVSVSKRPVRGKDGNKKIAQKSAASDLYIDTDPEDNASAEVDSGEEFKVPPPRRTRQKTGSKKTETEVMTAKTKNQIKTETKRVSVNVKRQKESENGNTNADGHDSALKKGRGTKSAKKAAESEDVESKEDVKNGANKEEKKVVKSAGAKKMMSGGGGKGRKRAATTVDSKANKDDEHNGADEKIADNN